MRNRVTHCSLGKGHFNIHSFKSFFGIALKLKPVEFNDFLQNAGFALSDSSIFDLVIRFCVEREIFSLHDVNALLLQADQKTLAKEAA